MVNLQSFPKLCFLLMKSKNEVFFSGSVAGIAVLVIDRDSVAEKSNEN